MLNQPQRILIIDSNIVYTTLIVDYLRLEGFEVTVAYGRNEARTFFAQPGFDAVILDVNAEGKDAEQLLSEREESDNRPILFFSKTELVHIKTLGTVLPIDGFQKKPCPPRDLFIALSSLVTHSPDQASVHDPLSMGPLTFNPAEHSIAFDGITIELTATEFLLIKLLAQHINKPFRKEHIYEQVLGRPMHANDRAIDVHVSSIRHKFQPIQEKGIAIENIRGVGYQLAIREITM